MERLTNTVSVEKRVAALPPGQVLVLLAHLIRMLIINEQLYVLHTATEHVERLSLVKSDLLEVISGILLKN